VCCSPQIEEGLTTIARLASSIWILGAIMSPASRRWGITTARQDCRGISSRCSRPFGAKPSSPGRAAADTARNLEVKRRMWNVVIAGGVMICREPSSLPTRRWRKGEVRRLDAEQLPRRRARRGRHPAGAGGRDRVGCFLALRFTSFSGRQLGEHAAKRTTSLVLRRLPLTNRLLAFV
jgi:hypothetical protein